MAWDFRRWLRHEQTGAGVVRRALPSEALNRLKAAIAASEKCHNGEIRLAIEPSLRLPLFRNGLSARERAISVFSDLRIWDTEANNGVLIYLLWADRDVEIVADRGIHEIVGSVGWEEICHGMEQAFRLGFFEQGLEEGIREVATHLETHFPHTAGDRNEIPDEPIILS